MILMTIVVGLLPFFVMAQDPGGDPDTNTPIDGGLSLLIAAGVGYGVKKYRAAKKKKNEEEETDLK